MAKNTNYHNIFLYLNIFVYKTYSSTLKYLPGIFRARWDTLSCHCMASLDSTVTCSTVYTFKQFFHSAGASFNSKIMSPSHIYVLLNTIFILFARNPFTVNLLTYFSDRDLQITKINFLSWKSNSFHQWSRICLWFAKICLTVKHRIKLWRNEVLANDKVIQNQSYFQHTALHY